MNIINYVLLITGIITSLIGFAAFINPNLARFINFPGGPRLKALAALAIGLILLIIGFIVNIPVK